MAQILKDCPSEETAKVLEQMRDDDVVLLCRAMDDETIAKALVLSDKRVRQIVVSELSDEKLGQVMSGISVEDTRRFASSTRSSLKRLSENAILST